MMRANTSRVAGFSMIELVVVMVVSATAYVALSSSQIDVASGQRWEASVARAEAVAAAAMQFRDEHATREWPNNITDLITNGYLDNGVHNYDTAYTLQMTNAIWQQGGGVEIYIDINRPSGAGSSTPEFERTLTNARLQLLREFGSSRIRAASVSGDTAIRLSVMLPQSIMRDEPSPFVASADNRNFSGNRSAYYTLGPIAFDDVLSLGNVGLENVGNEVHANVVQSCGFCKVYNNLNDRDNNEGGNFAIANNGSALSQDVALWLNRLEVRAGETWVQRVVAPGVTADRSAAADVAASSISLHLTNTLAVQVSPDVVMAADLAYFADPWGSTLATPYHGHSAQNTRNHTRAVTTNSITFNNTTLWNTLGIDCDTLTVNWMFFYSDERLKNVGEQIDGSRALDLVRETPLHRYQWRGDQSAGLGVLAQDVASHQSLVGKTDDGIHKVSKDGMVGIAWASAQELLKQEQDLKQKLSLLDSEIARVKERLLVRDISSPSTQL